MRCEVCGKEIDHSSYLDAELCSSSNCYNIKYWIDIIKENRESECHFLNEENNMIYAIVYENAQGTRGFGGSTYAIELEDGTRFKTTNMWLNGECPKVFRDFFRKMKILSLQEVNIEELKTFGGNKNV